MGRTLRTASPPTPRPLGRRALGAALALGAAAILAALIAGLVTGGSGGGRAASARALWRPGPVGAPTARVYVDRESRGGGCSDERPAAQAESPSSPWCGLQRAVSAAPAGALVSVRAGSYGPLQIREFHRRRFLQLAAYPGERVSIAGISIQRSDHLRFQGFDIDGRMDVTDSASDLQFADNVIAHQRSGMYLYGYAKPRGVVRRVWIDHNLIEAIDYTGAQGVAEGYGIQMTGNVADVAITGNTIRSVAEDYVQGGGSNIRVTGNHFLGPTLSGSHPQAHADLWQIFEAATHIVFAHNLVRDTGTSTGLLFEFSGPDHPYSDVAIEDNLFDHGSGGYEMQIYNTRGLRIEHNRVLGSRFGTLLRDDPRVPPGSGYSVLHNTFDSQDGEPFAAERKWGVEDYNRITHSAAPRRAHGAHDVFGPAPGHP